MDVWADNQRGETVAKGRVLAVVPKDEDATLTKASGATGLVYQEAVGYGPNGVKLAKKKATKKTTKKKTTKKKTSKKSS